MIAGRLTRDPETRSTQSGQSVSTVSIATNHRWNDKNGQKQEKAEFHTVIVWGKLSEIVAQYLIKGQEAYFEGRLQTRAYTGKDGVERRVTEIVAENMQLGSRPTGGGQGGDYARSENSSQQSQSKSSHSTKAAPVDDDIPTINLDDEKEEIRIEDVPF